MSGNDIYAPQLTALMGGPHRRAKSAGERAGYLIGLTDRWDTEALGDWRDAVAIAGRRQGVHSRSSMVLLAKILWGLDSKRAAEIGRIAEKFRTRFGNQVAKEVAAAGSIKMVSRSDFAPSKRPRIRKTHSA